MSIYLPTFVTQMICILLLFSFYYFINSLNLNFADKFYFIRPSDVLSQLDRNRLNQKNFIKKFVQPRKNNPGF